MTLIEIIHALLVRLQADISVRVDLSDLIKEVERHAEAARTGKEQEK